MARLRITALILILILLGATTSAYGDPCAEFFQSTSGPHGGWLGLHTDGSNYGMGQSFTLNCGSRLESVAFHIYWGTDYGDVRSLAFGDVVHMSVFKTDGEELLRKDYTIDENSGNRTVTFYLTSDNLLLVEGTYIAAMWTSVAACGGMKGYNADVVTGTCYRSTTATDLTSWAPHASEAVHTIVADSDVTPVDNPAWGTIKSLYR